MQTGYTVLLERFIFDSRNEGLNLKKLFQSNVQMFFIMAKEDYLIKKFGLEKPFKIPDGYFDSFTDRMMDKLPERTFEEESGKVVSLWDRVKPLVYLAAMFAGIALMFGIAEDFVSMQESDTVNVASTNIEQDLTYPVYSEEAADFCNYMMIDNDIDDYSMYQYLENVVE